MGCVYVWKYKRYLYFVYNANVTLQLYRLQKYASKVRDTRDVFLERFTGGLFRFMLLQRPIESPADRYNEETVYRRRKLWIAFVQSRSLAFLQTPKCGVSNGNVAEWAKSITKGTNGRSSSIKGDQGVNDDTPLLQRGRSARATCLHIPRVARGVLQRGR